MIHFISDKYQRFDFKQQTLTLCFDIDEGDSMLDFQTQGDMFDNIEFTQLTELEFEFQVWVKQNHTNANKTGTIRMQLVDGKGNVFNNYFALIQTYNDTIVEFVQNSMRVAQDEYTYDADIRLYKTHNVVFDTDVNWIDNIVLVQGTKVFFHINPNYGGERTGTIRALDKDDEFVYAESKIDIVQDANSYTKDAMLRFNQNDYYIDYDGGADVFVGYNELGIDQTTLTATSTDSWIVNIRIDSPQKVVLFDVLPTTDTTNDRFGTIELTGIVSGTQNKLHTILNVIQSPTPEYIQFPIDEDTEIVLKGDDEYIDYRFDVEDVDDTYYYGRAYLNNGEAKIIVNDILRDTLKNTFSFNEGFENTNLFKTATLYTSKDEWASATTEKILYYFYKYTYTPSYNKYVSKHIYSFLDRRQKFVFSIKDSFDESPTSITVKIKHLDDTVEENVYTTYNSISTLTINDLSDISEINVDDLYIYRIVDSCMPYVLYWLNSEGGMSSCLFNRSALKSSALAFNTIKTKVNNQTIRFSEKHWNININDSWQLNTERLNDEEAENIYDLFTSTEIYLQNLEDGTITPVILTVTSVNYLNFHNNKNKKVVYTINLKASQSKIKR